MLLRKAAMNLVIITGNVGRDVELKHIGEKNTAVVELVVATNEYGRNKQKYTEWHNCKLYGKNAENTAKYVEKGCKVGVTGRLQTRSWEGKDGQKRYRTDIIVDKIEFLTRREQTEQEKGDEFMGDIPPPENVEDMGGDDSKQEDLPF